MAQAIAGALRAAGWSVRRDLAPELDLVLWIAPTPNSVTEASAYLTDALITARDTQASLEQAAQHGRAAFVTLTRLDGRLGMSELDSLDHAVLGGLPGLVKTLAIEAPSVFCRALDLAPELPAERCAELLAELADSQTDLTQAGYDADETRWTVSLVEQAYDPEVAEPGPDDLLVVTGGGRGVTAACAIGLAERYKCGLLLLGRTPLVEQPEWAFNVPTDSLKPAIVNHLRAQGTPKPRDVERLYRDLVATREIEQTLARIRENSHAEYLSVDITDADAVANALSGYRITGVVHGAGVLADQVIAGKQAKDVERVLAPKLSGLDAVLSALDDGEPRHIVLFSSVAGFFGNRGQADYAMANEALNRMAVVLKRRHPNSLVTAINWGAWAGGMVTPELARMFTERGVTLIPLEEGVKHFVEQFQHPHVVTVIGQTTPLSVPPVRSSGSLVLSRDLARIAKDPILHDHTIGGRPVLPATVAIGAVLNAVSRVRPELRTLTDFAVLKGLVFDGEPGALRLRIVERNSPGSVGVLLLDETDRPRYQAVMSDSALPPTPVLTGLTEPSESVTAYTDGTLFHGPKLHGLRRMSPNGLVFSCQLPESVLADGAYATDTYCPVLADLLLQAALVHVHRERGVASLPVAVGGVECHAILPADEPFYVVVEQTGSVDSRVMCTVTACAPNGRVLLRFRDVDLVCSQALAGKFAVGA